MAGVLTSFVHSLIGADNPGTLPYDDEQTRARQQQAQYGSREAQNYGQEQDLANSLEGTIRGTAPSVAQSQLRQAIDQNNADSMAAGAGASGVDAVLARYQARQAQGEQAARLQQAAAELRAREVAQAQMQLGGLRATMGAQSGGLYGVNLDEVLNLMRAKSALEQQNAQRDTVLGAAGLGGASALGAGLSSMGADYFRSQPSSGGGGAGGGYGSAYDGRGDNLMSPSF